MLEELDKNSVIGILTASVYYYDEFYDKLINKVTNAVKNYKQNSDASHPKFENIFHLVLSFNNVKYSVQIVGFSVLQCYGFVSGASATIFKAYDKQKKSLKLCLDGEEYFVNVDRNGSKINVNVNDSKTFCIHKMKDYNGPISTLKIAHGNQLVKINELTAFNNSLSQIKCILKGFNLPEPHFGLNLSENLDIIFKNLQNPLLPTQHFQECLEPISKLLPNTFVMELQQIVAIYTSNSSSIFCKFPSNHIRLVTDQFISQINNTNKKTSFASILRPILELAEMFSAGMRGYAQRIIDDILLTYLTVESKFQFDESDNAISDVKMLKLIPADIISHANLKNKNKLIMSLMDYIEKHLPGLVVDLKPTIQKILTQLIAKQYSVVVAKFREILVTCQVPSYEVRKNKMEAILLSNCSDAHFSNTIDSLETLIDSNSEFFDIISDFFYHKRIEVTKCALEVYFRRAYLAYDITSFQHVQLSTSQLGVVFKYNLSLVTRRKKNELKRSNSILGITNSSNRQKYTQSALPMKYNLTESSRQSSDISSILSTSGSQDDSLILLNQCTSSYQQNGGGVSSTDTDDSAVSTGPPSLAGGLTDVDSYIFNDPNLNGSSSLDRSNHKVFNNKCQNQSNKINNSLCFLDKPPSINSLNMLDQYRDCHMTRHGSIFVNKSNGYNRLSDIYTQTWGEMGVSVIFRTLEELNRDFNAIISIMDSTDNEYTDYLIHNMSPTNSESEITNYKIILYIILNDPSLTILSDEDLSVKFLEFCKDHYLDFRSNNTIWVTFMVQSVEKDIRYFTYRCKSNFEEDKMCRQIDPALSFQLELSRLKYYQLERLSVPNRRMYVYFGKKDSLSPIINKECRIFVRCILHHNDLSCATSSLEYLAREAERSLLESLESVEMVFGNISNPEICDTRSNHIFFNFHSVLVLDKLDQLESVVRRIVLKYGRRLWSSRIMQAELKMNVRLNNEFGCHSPVRLWVHNEGGRSLDIGIYREQTSSNQKILVSIGGTYSKEARYHGLSVDSCYSL